MNLLGSVIISALLLLPFPAFAEIKTVTHTVQQPFGGSQSPDDARIAGIARAKREALERAGTYIESTTIVKNSQVDSDEILALTAGVAKAEVIKQKNYTDGDTFGIEITVKVEIDTNVAETSLKMLLEDRNRLKDLKAAREREKKLLSRIAELEETNRQKGKTEQQAETLKQAFQAASQGLTAEEWVDKAMALCMGTIEYDSERVLEYLSEAIRLDPNYAYAYKQRGTFVYFNSRQYDLAMADYDQAIRLDPGDADTYRIRGFLFSRLKQFDRALADYDQAIRLDSNNVDGYSGRGDVFVELKKFDRAIADYNHAIHLDPNSGWVFLIYSKRGDVYAELKQFHLAIADFDRVIRLESSNNAAVVSNDTMRAESYRRRGNAYLELKQFDHAIEDFNKAIRLDPDDVYAYYFRGNTYLELKQFKRAIADMDRVIKAYPKFAVEYNNRGAAYLQLKMVNKGCADLKKACKLGSCDVYENARREKKCR